MTLESGALFVVATPVGNLDDITLRAIEALRACDGVLAEDTRRTRQLLSHLGIAGKRVERLDMHASPQAIDHAIARLSEGASLALVSDAGTPVVSDPGDALVRAAVARGIRIVPIPGPSAVLCALVASALADDGRFRFVGFLPRDGRKRREALETLSETPETAILFEAPTRLRETLADLAAAMPERDACVARELTKVHEEIVRGTCAELATLDRDWLGEVVVVLGPWAGVERVSQVSDDEVDALIERALAGGEPSKAIAQRLSAWTGRSKKAIYDLVVAKKRPRAD